MRIRNVQMKDWEAILEIYAYAREFMKKQGNPTQWGDSYPAKETLLNDIQEEKLYVCENDEGRIVGVFYFAKEDDPTYRVITEGQWLSDAPYAVVHRIASAKDTKGVATFCLMWAFGQTKNLRIDTHDDNIPMQSLLKKLDFCKCGRIYLPNGSPRIAYQKQQ